MPKCNKKNTNYSEVICVVDRSGSMASVWDDTVGGINEFIKKQKEIPGKANLSLVFFDTEYDMPFDGVSVKDRVFDKPMTFADYAPRGGTALYDALGKAINAANARFEKNKPNKVIMCIVTDGHENSSREFTQESVKKLIEKQTSENDWEFVYLGANQDAFAVGGGIGIAQRSCASYAVGTEKAVFSASACRSLSFCSDVDDLRSVEEIYSAEVSSTNSTNESKKEND